MKQDCRNVADKSVQAGKAYTSGASVGAVGERRSGVLFHAIQTREFQLREI
jgi:hypothetical protein